MKTYTLLYPNFGRSVQSPVVRVHTGAVFRDVHAGPDGSLQGCAEVNEANPLESRAFLVVPTDTEFPEQSAGTVLAHLGSCVVNGDEYHVFECVEA